MTYLRVGICTAKSKSEREFFHLPYALCYCDTRNDQSKWILLRFRFKHLFIIELYKREDRMAKDWVINFARALLHRSLGSVTFTAKLYKVIGGK